MNRNEKNVNKLTMLGMMTALVFVSNYLRITMPIAIGGRTSFTLANIMCCLSGLLLGPVGGSASEDPRFPVQRRGGHHSGTPAVCGSAAVPEADAYSASLIFGLPCPGPFVKYHMGAGLVFLLRKSIIKFRFDVGKRRTE